LDKQRLVVRLHDPRRLRLVLLACVALVLLLCFGLFELGQRVGGYSSFRSDDRRQALRTEVKQLRLEGQQLKDTIARLQTSLEVDREAQLRLTATLAESEARIAELNEELEFYRRIVAPPDGQTGLRVQTFEVLGNSVDNGYRLRLLLVQSPQRSGRAQGQVEVSLRGTLDGRGSEPDAAATRRRTAGVRFPVFSGCGPGSGAARGLRARGGRNRTAPREAQCAGGGDQFSMAAERLRRTKQMFGKKKLESGAIATLIGAGTTVTGDLDFRGGLHLDGRIVGDVSSEPGTASCLTIGGDGVIEGSVNVDDVVLNGTVRGDVTARERVELGATAQVDGNVAYQVLQMAAGARVNGRLIHQKSGQQVGPSPDPQGISGDSSARPGDGDPRAALE
jgi:cytoskeletal protein CcmA (bactofilin family)